MKLRTNHPDPKISAAIMDYLYEKHDIVGNEEYLSREKIIDILGPRTFIDLEISVSKVFDENIDLPKDLLLVQDSIDNIHFSKTYNQNGKPRINSSVEC